MSPAVVKQNLVLNGAIIHRARELDAFVAPPLVAIVYC